MSPNKNNDESNSNYTAAPPLTQDIFKQFLDAQSNQMATQIQESAKNIMEHTSTQLNVINNSIGLINKTLYEQEEKICQQDKKIQEQSFEISQHADKIKSLEIALRRKNLIFYGVPDTENNDEELRTAIAKITNENPKEFEFLYRLGKKVNNSEKPRPVLVGFFSYERKQSVLRASSKLKPYGLSEDFLKEVALSRKNLLPEMKKLREEGKRVSLRADKLYVDGKLWQSENNVTNIDLAEIANKRKYISLSPEAKNSKRPTLNETGISTLTQKKLDFNNPPTTSKNQGIPQPTKIANSEGSRNFPVFKLNRNPKNMTNQLNRVPGGSPRTGLYEIIQTD